ncbi:hypothetical protein [Microbacterium sp.]|uniref:hypothetical protein n=1 Tax=Microbacterium sp. TaxID=51671 RepID=UPI003A91395C
MLVAIGTERQVARATAWALASAYAPDVTTSPDAPAVIDLGATFADRERLTTSVDHRPAGIGGTLAIKLLGMLRIGLS